MEAIGLDVGFSATRPSSGVARFSSDGILRVGHATSDWASRSAVAGEEAVQVAAIDAPYTRIAETEPRACERVFTLGPFGGRCKPGLSHVPGTGRELRRAGWETAQQLKPLAPSEPLRAQFPRIEDCNVVEAFPNAYLGVCVPSSIYDTRPSLRRGKKFDWLYDRWVDSGLFHRAAREVGLPESVAELCDSNAQHDERAALVCLLTASGVASGRYTAVGDPDGGYFFLPTFDLWADWAREGIEGQRVRVPDIEVWKDGTL